MSGIRGGGVSLAAANTWTAVQTFSAGAQFNGDILFNGVTSSFPGFRRSGTNILLIKADGSDYGTMESTGFTAAGGGEASVAITRGRGLRLGSINNIRWSSTTAYDGTADLFIERDAANTKAQRNAENPQADNIYNRWGSATDYHRLKKTSIKALASAVSGATVTLTNLIPDGAIVVGISSKITTALGITNGTSGFQIGDGVDPDRWGAVAAVTLGTTSDNRDWTNTTIQAFIATNNVVLTAVGGDFDGTGAIEVIVHYLIGEAD